MVSFFFFFGYLHKPINFVTFDESVSFSLIPLNIYYLISLIIDKTIVNVSLNFENLISLISLFAINTSIIDKTMVNVSLP